MPADEDDDQAYKKRQSRQPIGGIFFGAKNFARQLICDRRSKRRRCNDHRPIKGRMIFLGGDLGNHRYDKECEEDRRRDVVPQVDGGHRQSIPSGFTKRRRNDLDDPESQGDSRHFSRHRSVRLEAHSSRIPLSRGSENGPDDL